MTYTVPTYDDEKYQHKESIYAALALDSYSRGFGAKVHLTDGSNPLLEAAPNTQLGAATILFDSVVLGELSPGVRRDEAVGFSATAYVVGDEIVISYRGSDQLWGGPGGLLDDFGTVANIAAGNIDDHIRLALEFFNEVQQSAAAAGLPIVTVGHSLGGALAGIVANLKQVAGLMFDNTGFEWAVETAVDLANASDVSGDPEDQVFHDLVFAGSGLNWSSTNRIDLTATSLKTIALTHDVAGMFFRGDQAAQQDQSLGLGNFVIIPGWDSATAHNQALLAYRIFLEEEFGQDDAWTHAAAEVLSPLMSDTYAANLGIVASVWGNEESGVLKDMISQTIFGGEFGNSAARAMTNDMQDLGKAIMAGLAVGYEVAADVTRYASMLAINSVIGAFDGVLDYDVGDGLLHVDRAFDTWAQVSDSAYHGARIDWSALVADHQIDLFEANQLRSGPGRIEYATYATEPTQGNFLASISGHADTVSSYTGTSANDIVQGSAHNEAFYLGEGDNQVTTGGGFDWVYGGTGHDTLSTGLVWADFDITVETDGTVLMVADADTANPTVIVAKGVETFLFAGAPLSLAQLTNGGPTDISMESIAGQVQHAGLTEGTYYGGALIAQLGVTDPNSQDRFTWELVGNSADFFSIDQNGRITTNGTQMFDYEFWHQTVGNLPLAEWEAGNPTPGFENLIGTQYAISVKVTDAHGESRIENLFLYMRDEVSEAPSSFNVWHNMIHTHVANLGMAYQLHLNNVVDADGGTNVLEIDPDKTDLAILPYLETLGSHARFTQVVAAGTYEIGVRTYDAANNVRSQTQVLTIEVHENTAPTGLIWGSTNLTGGGTPPGWWPRPNGQVAENPGYDQLIGFLDFSDPNDGANGGSGEKYEARLVGEYSHTYGIHDMGGGMLAVSVLQPGNVDFERDPNPVLTIEVTDTAGNISVFNLDVTVQDVASTTWSDPIVGSTTSVKSKTGTAQDDTLNASRSAAKYSLYGGAGGDLIYGGTNNDHIDGGIGNDTMYGGNGSDNLFALSGSDTVYGGMGIDTVHLSPSLRPHDAEAVYFSGGFLVIEKDDTVVRIYNDVENINIAVPWVGNISYTPTEYRDLFLAA